SNDGVDQDQYAANGNAWILKNYPQINFIERVSVTDRCPYKNRFH
ncbi:unnamed protein product, partial [Rotaria magnacalcarata]